MARIEIEVESTAQSYWITVDSKDVDMDDDFGTVVLADGDHLLYWGIYGAAGNAISIALKRDGNLIDGVQNRQIPPGRKRGGGYLEFVV